MRRTLWWVAGVVVLVAAACAGGREDGSAAGDGRGAAPRAATATTAGMTSFEVEQVPSSPREAVPAALEISDIPDIPTSIRFEDPAFGPPVVRSGDLRPGGPPPDGIPSIDRPRFHRVDGVDFLADREPVFVLDIDGDARAYPLQVMMWHEIVNDTVAGIPVAVTYCPLCNSAFAFDRRHEGRVLDFGVSGALWHSAMVMYDRQTRSLWSHFTGEGLLGVFASDQLATFPVALASWEEFSAAHPEGLVLSRDTGWPRDYGRNPYPGYDDIDNPPFLFEGEVDGRYAAKTRVIGLGVDGPGLAVVADRLQRDRVVTVELDGGQVVVWWQPGTGSALDAAAVAEGRDVGTTAAFSPVLDEQALRFEALDGGGFRDLDTGSEWNVFGTATTGPLEGRQLTAVTHVNTFWFAWAAYRPNTAIVD